ncbi:uncharacterized protein LOC144437668 isoform X1 [Glandiceps talaboti]
MGKSCCAFGCTNRHKKGCDFSFYRIPKDLDRRRQWLSAINRKNLEPKHAWLCSKHFITGAKNDDPNHPDYVPSVFSFITQQRKRKAETDLQRFERRSSKFKACMVPDEESNETEQETKFGKQEEMLTKDLTQENNDASIKLRSEVAELKEMNSRLIIENKQLRDDNQNLKIERDRMKERLDTISFSEETFSLNEKKCSFYTGLPNFVIVKMVFNLVASHIKTYSQNKLTQFQEFLSVLMKLRLNLLDEDLSYRFGVDQSTISRIFNRWVPVMSSRLSSFIIWPDREVLRSTMPLCFRDHFKNCVVILDCFEVFSERPTDLVARAQTWSNYKHHNTAKFLIGISPQGTIIYISKAWGGRVSDVYLTESCGILKKLLPGDEVLADRGFTIEASVSAYRAVLKIPAFTKGKLQLERKDIDWSRELAHVRIHVERVIGLLRNKYRILQGTLPIKMIMNKTCGGNTVVDDIAIVCSALCNLCESVVPQDT